MRTDPATVPILITPDPAIVNRFSDRMRQGIAHRLGWDNLRPVQQIATQAILDGLNTVILAPTAGGKTEASFLPVLDRIYTERAAAVSCIYVSPTRALLNNQEQRAAVLSSLVGLTSFKWHGDVGDGERQRFHDEPDHVLLTTPESLEAMLQSPRRETSRLFGELRYLIIDEAHSFAAGDRGAHLLSVTERLQKLTPHDIQRIGLSATVGNPQEMALWLAGSSDRDCCVVDPVKPPAQKRLAVRSIDDEVDLGDIARQIIGPDKAIFFVNGRRDVEGVTLALRDVGLDAWPHHGSLSRERREEAETRFATAERGALVATSTMELGIDIGDLDLVLQLDAPATVSSYLQRMGRTGRRAGTVPHLEFLTVDEGSFLLALALIHLAQRGWVEDAPCPTRAAHVLLHQILAKVREHWGVSRVKLKEDLRLAPCFRDIAEREFDALLDYLVSTDILSLSGGLFAFGEAGEKAFSRRHFMELYAVFSTPAQVIVETDKGEPLGMLDTWFVEAMAEGEAFVFILAGQTWVTKHIDLESEPPRIVVAPAGEAEPPKWMGLPALMSREVAEAHREVLLSDDERPWIFDKAVLLLRRLRKEWRAVLERDRVPVQLVGRDVQIHTFAGARINQALKGLLELQTRHKVTGGNLTVTVLGEADGFAPAEKVTAALHQIAAGTVPTPEQIQQIVADLPRWRLSKFQPYLPPNLEAEFMAERLLDFAGLREVLTIR